MGGRVMSIQEKYRKKALECFIAAEGMADPARRLFLLEGGVYEPISGDDGSVNTGPLLSKKVRGVAIVGHGGGMILAAKLTAHASFLGQQD
jgi:hypothetical protein